MRVRKKMGFVGDITSVAWVQVPPTVYKNPSIFQINMNLPLCITYKKCET